MMNARGCRFVPGGGFGGASMHRTFKVAEKLCCLIALGFVAACKPSQIGEWKSGGDLEVVGIHAALMPNGKVLTFGYQDAHHFVDEVGRFQQWDPGTRGAAGASLLLP